MQKVCASFVAVPLRTSERRCSVWSFTKSRHSSVIRSKTTAERPSAAEADALGCGQESCSIVSSNLQIPVWQLVCGTRPVCAGSQPRMVQGEGCAGCGKAGSGQVGHLANAADAGGSRHLDCKDVARSRRTSPGSLDVLPEVLNDEVRSMEVSSSPPAPPPSRGGAAGGFSNGTQACTTLRLRKTCKGRPIASFR